MQRNRAHICSFFVKGTCNRGAECPFRHEMPETGPLATQNIRDRYYGVNDPVAQKMLGRLGERVVPPPPEDTSIVTLFVGNVEPNWGPEDLQPLFEAHGTVTSVKVIHNKNCAFVNFATRAVRLPPSHLPRPPPWHARAARVSAPPAPRQSALCEPRHALWTASARLFATAGRSVHPARPLPTALATQAVGALLPAQTSPGCTDLGSRQLCWWQQMGCQQQLVGHPSCVFLLSQHTSAGPAPAASRASHCCRARVLHAC